MPLLLDLFCGRGGWAHAAIAAGWECVGYDVHDHGYPGRLVTRSLPVSLAELEALKPDLVVASPPCEQFARVHLPWLSLPPSTLLRPLRLLRWSIRIGRRLPCPCVVECSRFAARHVPGARFTGSYALWGDVPALLPDPPRRKTHRTGMRPAARALVEPLLARWIVDVFTPRSG